MASVFQIISHLPFNRLSLVRHCIFRKWPLGLTHKGLLSSLATADHGAVTQQPSSTYTSSKKAEHISQAMKAYLKKSQKHEDFMTKEISEYEIGKRHLAHIMGLDPDAISQADIDEAIEYLLPSGIYDKKARPFMKHPTDFMPKRKEAQFGADGRPFHSLYYTRFPNFFQLALDIVQKLEELKKHEDSLLKQEIQPEREHQMQLVGSQWIPKLHLEERLKETIDDRQYDQFVKLMERLAAHPYSMKEDGFLKSFRIDLISTKLVQELPPIQYDEAGRSYAAAYGVRKKARADVKVWNNGTGQLVINGKDMIDVFANISEREQIMYPLHFLDCIGEVDIEATVQGGGPQSQAGAIRLAVSKAIRTFEDEFTVEKMRLAGLLTRDPRKAERQKPGQAGARKKFTWKKR